MRLIDADAIKLQKGFFERVDNVPKFYEWLNSLPTIDAVPVVHGEWVLSKSASPWIEYKCSKCSAITEYATHYCPNCGAEMYGKEQDDAVD